MSVRGWVYIITNKAMPGLVKVGYSTKDPHLRAQEFDGAGIPHPYDVIYDALLLEPRDIEQKVHALLKDKREGREWFRCSIEESIKAIRSASMDQHIIETTNQHIIQTVEQKSDKRFITCDGGTVLDTVTNLMWANKSIGDGISWLKAKSYCENYHGGGYLDWRMPTLDEMDGLYRWEGLYMNENFRDVIEISNRFLWTSSIATFDFRNGEHLVHLPSDYDKYHAVLPVRSAK